MERTSRNSGQSAENPSKLFLAIDAAAPHFSGAGDVLFTPEGEPAAVATSAMNFLTAYQTAANRTESAHQSLLETGVIVAKTLTQEIDQQVHAIGGFSVVDQEKLNALPDETLAQWAREWVTGDSLCSLGQPAAPAKGRFGLVTPGQYQLIPPCQPCVGLAGRFPPSQRLAGHGKKPGTQ
ncbi:MAG: SapC family protein [Accumulibacter sp.]|jgi:hypothetical protein|uniref:SapC family protein n=1 Tax=Accumulibacter sp. TaxID=2053492 RepID=UPI002FC39B2B